MARADGLTVVERLRVEQPTDRAFSWAITALITLIGFVIRSVNLAYPNKLVFDETYYAKDAYSLLRFGYEREWPDNANDAIVAGNLDVMKDSAAFIVHPQVGKWLIAFGEYLFGMNSFGWRFSSLVFGSLLIFVVIRLVRRISRSTLIGGLAGLLLAFDGLAFVMSRIALLDIFLAVFVVAAVACLIADRDWFRNKLADHLSGNGLADLGGRFGPALIIRPWRIAAGVCFGLALGTKWNALYPLAAFALLSLAWDVGARRVAGAGVRSSLAIIRDGIPAFVSLVVLSVIIYVASWASWLAGSDGYLRDWGQNHPDALSVRLLGDPLASLLAYNQAIWNFHTGDGIAQATHPYDANPAGWLVLGRVIGIDAVLDIPGGTDGCPAAAEKCYRVISGIGTPALWWAAVIALVAALVLWVGGRDWRFGIPVVGVLSNWLPWFQYTDRPQFLFYAITIVPFSVTAVALVLGRLLGSAADLRAGPGAARRAVPDPSPEPVEGQGPTGLGTSTGPVHARHQHARGAPSRSLAGLFAAGTLPLDRRAVAAIGIGAFIALVGANFAFIYPILTDAVLTYQQWRARMWIRGWI
ncbi:dolichyl-phosphate-mannose--protein mannosyltransferase [Microlunatus parietis]|uniref:Polyprenol-phosphate-mannose--protein mannosyltransferase n=1 Tax=Microlunatus parietis TaxID=682979 RepID=A0A7Y9I5U1_9ACTN|nr:phospholipid carrier-dependent glycosyltransferase [Microlunatus parietis]NYE70566.1 dolichyl-phosphate-mannose--protein O-mannosyl transferase [Microlunatus parietis]